MNRRVAIILLCAFVLAAGCSFLLYRIVGTRVAVAHSSASKRIVAAASDIKLGTVLTASNLTTIEVTGTPPAGALLKPESAIGRGVISDLYQGEPVIESRLAPVGSGGGLAATIRQGMRACAVKVDEVVGVAGFVTPGMRVDVLISGDPPGKQNSPEGAQVKTLLQNIEVLSAGTDIQKDEQGKPQQVHVVNLLVTPEQAEQLSLASNETHIQLVLRNPLDTETAKVSGSAMGELFPGVDGTPAQPHHSSGHGGLRNAPPQMIAVEVINGSTRVQQKFPTPWERVKE
jgi:pilus assembly protein CpaB